MAPIAIFASQMDKAMEERKRSTAFASDDQGKSPIHMSKLGAHGARSEHPSHTTRWNGVGF